METTWSVNPSSLGTLNSDELKQVASSLAERVERLERLVQVISRGKYMWESTFDAITLPVQIERAGLPVSTPPGKALCLN